MTLMAEAHADDRRQWGDETVMVVARAHNGTPVYTIRGVGYFERGGTLRSGESARLDFKASDMNDVLKSLTISGQNGGKVTGLRYDSSEPLDQKLADFPFKLDGQASLALFLDQMKGAKVELKYGAETITGTVVSGRVVKGDDKQPEREVQHA